jgi:hypothetical protein
MSEYETSGGNASISAHVRPNVVPAAIVAVLMCAYGFGRLARPETDSLFGWCNLVLYYTLRIGGIGFGLVAIWSLIGQLPALVVDAVLSIACGVIFMLTALGRWVDGGDVLNSALFVVFGWMFIGVGLRNWRLYQHLAHSPGHDVYGTLHETAWEQSPLDSEPMADTDVPQGADNDGDRSMDAMSYPDEHLADTPGDISETLDDESSRSDGGFLAGFGRTGAPPGV